MKIWGRINQKIKCVQDFGGKLNVFLYNDKKMLCLIALDVSASEPCSIHFCQCWVKSDLVVGFALIDEICECQGHVLILLES